MAAEYKGDDFLYLLEINSDEPESKKSHRFFNQTDGSRSISADDIELSTKDKTGSDYGSVTEEISIEGVLTQDDPAIEFVVDAIRGKKLVRLIRVDTKSEKTEEGFYKLNNFEQSDSSGEFATYSIDAKLNGKIEKGELTELPEGAPEEDPSGVGAGA